MNTVLIVVLVVVALGAMYGLSRIVKKKNERPILKDGKPIKDLPGDEPKEKP